MAKRITEYIGAQRSGTAAQKQLQQLVERYPYYQAARLLLLRALFDAHDPRFGQELRRAALYVPSRRVLYELIEADRLRPRPESRVQHKEESDLDDAADRTQSLIANFLSNLPEEKPKTRKARPSVDAATDYMAYMLQVEADTQPDTTETDGAEDATALYGQQIIDGFLQQGKITIQDHPEEELQKPEFDNSAAAKGEIFTETLAHIYIKQGKFDKAIEIIQRLSLKYPKKNRYFADQIRYLEKIIANNNNKK